MATQPDFKVSDKKKQTADWYKNAADWLINKAIASNDKAFTRRAINVASGTIDTNAFKKVMQPFANAPEEVKNLPGEIRSVDFITPIREKNIGEYIVLPYQYFVTVENPDVITDRDAMVAKVLIGELQQATVEYISSLQQEGKPPVEPDPIALKEKINKVKQEFFDSKVENAQHILDFINTFNDFDYQRINAFNDWWMTEEFYTHRYIRNGELYREILNVADSYPISNNKEFVEDYDGFVYRQRITFQEFEQHYAHLVDEEEQNYLKSITYNKSMGGYVVPVNLIQRRGDLDNIVYHTGNSNNVFIASESMDLWTIYFVAQSPVVELTYKDQLGRIQHMHVDSSYELNPANNDLKLEDIWIPKVYIQYRFGGPNIGVYTKPEPITVQRYDHFSNTVKLPIGGKKGLLRGVKLNPIPIRLEPYLIVDRILLLAIERTIAKFRADLITMPQSLLNPDKAGTPHEKYQHMLADDTLIYDDSKIDIQTVLQGIRAIGRTNIAQYIETLWNLRLRNKQDAFDVSNMNSERLGQGDSNQTATGYQNNLMYAKLGSILMVTMFHSALEKDHLADLEFSKYAYISGKNGTYFDKQKQEYIEFSVDPAEHYFNKYGMSVSNSKASQDIMDSFKRFAFNASQNGEFKMASVAITATTPQEIARTINEFAEAKETYERSIREREVAAIEEANALKKAELEIKRTNNQEDNATDVMVAKIQTAGKVMTTPEKPVPTS